MFVLCHTPDEGVCVVLYIRCRSMYFMVLYVMCGCMCVVHTVYMYVVEEKALGVCQVWQLIQCAYKNNIR